MERHVILPSVCGVVPASAVSMLQLHSDLVNTRADPYARSAACSIRYSRKKHEETAKDLHRQPDLAYTSADIQSVCSSACGHPAGWVAYKTCFKFHSRLPHQIMANIWRFTFISPSVR